MQALFFYAQKGRHGWWHYPLTLVLATLATLVLSMLVLLPLMLTGVLPADFLAHMQSPDQPAAFFITTGASFGFIVLGLAAAVAVVHRKSPLDLLGAWRWSDFAVGLSLWLMVLLVLTAIDFALAPGGFRPAANAATTALILWSVPTLLIQTFAEEYLFRGYLTQGLLLAIRNPVVAAMISGLIFGVAHIPNGLPQTVFATIFGVVLALLAIRTGGLAFGVGLHFVNNLFGAVVVVSGGDVFKGAPGLFAQNTPHLMWWDVAAAAASAAIVLAVVWRRQGRATAAS